MKRNFTFRSLVMSLTALSFFGCSEAPETAINGDERVAINVGANINNTTKAVDAVWSDNDLIGITMFDKGTQTLAEGNFRNKKYIIRSAVSTKFDPFTDDQTIFFPKNGSQVDFLTYYPYNVAITDSYVMPIDVSNQTVLPAIDFMTAEHIAGYSKADPQVKFKFHHKLSKIIIVLQDQGGNPIRLVGSKIMINGLLTKATYNLLDPSSIVVVDGSSMAALTFPSDATGANALGIVLPRNAGAGVVFNVELTDGSKYTGNMANDLALLSGYQYTFYLSLNKTAIDVSASIQPWVTVPDITLQALAITTPPNASLGVKLNDVMRVYNNGNLLTTFTYNASNKWVASTPYYWETLVGSSFEFKGAITAAAALNGTQLADILVADPLTVVRNNGINFIFRHAATKVTTILSSSDNSFSTAELNGATIKLPSYLIGGTEVGGVFVPGSSHGDINLVGNVAIFQPQTIAAAANLAIVTIAGKDYPIVTPAGGIEFKKGEAVNLNINITKTGISVSATVVDWVAGSNIDLNGRYVAITTPGNTSGFANGSVIDFYVLNNNNTTTKFTYNGSNVWVPTTKIYWDALTTFPLNVAAISPSGVTTPNASGVVSWSVLSNQSITSVSSDLLVAYLAGLSNGASANLSFKHAMNKVNVVLTAGVGFTPVELDAATSVVIKNMHITCDVNLATLAITNPSNQVDIIANKTSSLNYSALVVPCTLTNGTQILTVTVAGISYPVNLSSAMTFKSTEYNTLTVTINKTPIGISCTIEGWTTGTNGSYIIQ